MLEDHASFYRAIKGTSILLQADLNMVMGDIIAWQEAEKTTDAALWATVHRLLPDVTPQTIKHLGTIAPGFFFAQNQRYIDQCSRAAAPWLIRALGLTEWHFGRPFSILRMLLRNLILEGKVTDSDAQKLWTASLHTFSERKKVEEELSLHEAFVTQLIVFSERGPSPERNRVALSVFSAASAKMMRESNYPHAHDPDPGSRTKDDWRHWIQLIRQV